jgi:predicted DNA-binding transcriptional regulator AlpA
VSDERTSEAQDGGTRKMLTIKQVLKLVPVSEKTLYRMQRDKDFPRSHPLDGKRRFWFEDEIAAWQKSLEESY